MVFFTDVNTGYVTGCDSYGVGLDLQGRILKTTDGGLTWTDILVTYENPDPYYSIFFPNAETGYACYEGNALALRIGMGYQEQVW